MFISKLFKNLKNNYKNIENKNYSVGFILDYNFELECTYVSEIFDEELKELVKEGDIIIGVNNKSVVFNSLFHIKNLLLGEYETEVVITFFRDRESITHTFHRNINV